MKYYAASSVQGLNSWLEGVLETFSEYYTWILKILTSLRTFGLVLGQAPAMVKNLALLLCIVGLIDLAHFSATGSWTYEKWNSTPVYGPPFIPPVTPKKYYSFEKVGKSFGLKFPLWRLGEIDQVFLHEMIFASTPRKLRERMEKYIDIAFHYAQKYQLDPFWLLSIMWVESHFNPKVKSPVKASGLMQIMPATSFWLNHLLERSLYPKLAYELTKDPNHNIQLGSFYLKRLMKTFKGNYVHATVAYNMGPGYTKRRLRWNLPVGTKNLYLDKVRRAYRFLTSGVRHYVHSHAPRYMETFVVKRRLPFEYRELEFVSWWVLGLPHDDVAYNDSKFLNKDLIF